MRIIKRVNCGDENNNIIAWTKTDNYFRLIIRLPIFIFSKKRYVDWESMNLYRGNLAIWLGFAFRIYKKTKRYSFRILKYPIFKRELISTEEDRVNNGIVPGYGIKLKGIEEI